MLKLSLPEGIEDVVFSPKDYLCHCLATVSQLSDMWGGAAMLLMLGITCNAATWPVMQTHVISMSKDLEREVHMNKQMKALGLSYFLVHGVDKEDLRDALQPTHWNPMFTGIVDNRIHRHKNLYHALTSPPYTTTYKNDLGTAAVAISHAHALLSAYDYWYHQYRNPGVFLVLEDDVVFDASFVDGATKAIKEVNKKDPEWSVLLLGYCTATGLPTGKHAPLVAPPTSHTCAHAYAVRNIEVGLEIVAAFLATEGIPAWDTFMASLYDTPEKRKIFRTYAYVPNDIVVQDRFAFDQHLPMTPPAPILTVPNPVIAW